MPRITVTFPDTYFQQLQERARQKGISVAHYIRDLVSIGHRIEEPYVQQEVPNSLNGYPRLICDGAKELWKNNLLCVLESRYLMRYLVRRLIPELPEKCEAVLNAVKEKADSVVTELLKS